MAETTTAPGLGTCVWTECGTRDAKAAIDFYTKLIGWTTESHDMGGMTYTMFKAPNGETVGGLYQMDDPRMADVPPHWLPYFLVENVDATAAKCKELGGQVMHVGDVPGMGRFGIISDPTGATMAVWQTNTPG